MSSLSIVEGDAIRQARISLARQNINPNLSPDQFRLASSQAATSPEVSADVSLDEIRRILGEEVASREAIKQKPLSGGTSRFQPVENKSFTQDQFDRAVEEKKGQKKYTFPAIQKAIRSCLLYTSPSPRDGLLARMPSSA